jgi:hypothetical protein
MGKATGNRQTATVRRPTPDEIIDACCAGTGMSDAIRNRLFTRCPISGTLFVSVYASAVRRAVAVIMRERGIGLAEIAAHLNYASRSGPDTLLRREPSNFEQRVEREARATLNKEAA